MEYLLYLLIVIVLIMFVFGPPGVGKGTIGEKLAFDLSFNYVSPG